MPALTCRRPSIKSDQLLFISKGWSGFSLFRVKSVPNCGGPCDVLHRYLFQEAQLLEVLYRLTAFICHLSWRLGYLDQRPTLFPSGVGAAHI